MVDLSGVSSVPLYGLDKTITIVVILGFTILFAKIIIRLLDRFFRKTSELIRIDPTQYGFLKHLVSGLIYLMGISIAVYTIPSLRALSISILAGAGVLAVVIGFASQQAFSNIISGVFIAVFRPIRVGDRVKIGADVSGVVEDITLRHTVIKTFENKRVIIPNSVISTQVIENANLGDDKVCKFIELGISYDSDVDKAIKIMREEAMKHSSFLDNRTPEEKKRGEPAVPVRVIGFGDSSVNLRAYVWAKDPSSAFVMSCDLNV